MKKITIIGAGSFSFSSRIIPDLMYFPELREFELCLMDTNRERLELVTAFAEAFKRHNGLDMPVTSCDTWKEAITDARYVIATFDVGGLEARRQDIEIPAEYGIYHAIGDTLGAAGIFNALRMAPLLRELAFTIRKYAPEALLVNYTNPMSANLRILHDAVPQLRKIGFCHGLEHSRGWLGRILGIAPSEIQLECAGVNHQMWMLSIRDSKGNDLYGKLRERLRDPRVRNLDRVRFDLMDLAGFYMTESSYHSAEYVPYFQSEFTRLELSENEEGTVDPLKETMDAEAILKANHSEIPARRRSMGWGDLQFVNHDRLPGVVETRLPIGFDVDRIGKFSDSLFERFRRSVKSGDTPGLQLSVEYLARLIHGLETGTSYSIYGNVENRGLITNLPEEAVVEVPVAVEHGELHPKAMGKLPEFCAALNRNFINVTLLIAEAVRTGSQHAVVQALAVDPVCCSNRLTISQLKELASRMIAANREYLDYIH